MFTSTLALTLSLALASTVAVNAIITPTSPDSNTVVKVGDKIQALWTADSTSSWKDVEIQLMTGDNLQMVALATVATGIDGTSATSYEFTAPDVSPYSKIYFLQFTNGGDMTAPTWTTRFTIASADGTTTEPTNSTVYSGTTVEWGTGTLLSTVTTDTSGSGSSSSSSNSTTASSAASGSSAVTTTSASESASSASASASSESASASAAASESASTSARSSGATTAAAAAASSSGSNSAAGRLEVGLGAVVLAGLAAYAAL
ncbi:hypothetical protein I317_01407 [Kwoniella heveanensis CBS 569]|nr:hypothetical protein I317_01407 [Kwoniella heveanensis CBS 569]